MRRTTGPDKALAQQDRLNRLLGKSTCRERRVNVFVDSTRKGYASHTATVYVKGDCYSPAVGLLKQIKDSVDAEVLMAPCVSVDSSDVLATPPSEIHKPFGRFNHQMLYKSAMKFLNSRCAGSALRIWKSYRHRGFFALYPSKVVLVHHDGSHWQCSTVPEAGIA